MNYDPTGIEDVDPVALVEFENRVVDLYIEGRKEQLNWWRRWLAEWLGVWG